MALWLTPNVPKDAALSNTPEGDAVGECKAARVQDKPRCVSAKPRPRRPDRAVYVPPALRAAEPDRDRRASHSANRPKCPNCNIYCSCNTPPHLPNQRADKAPSIPNGPPLDYFAYVQQGFYVPPYYSDCNSVPPVNNYRRFPIHKCVEEHGHPDLATSSIGVGLERRTVVCYKRGYEIGECKAARLQDKSPQKIDNENNKENTELKPKRKVSLKREDNDWEAVIDESGECLDPSLLEELSATVSNVHITTARHSYESYQSRGQALLQGHLYDTFPHVVEVYDFPPEFKTNDLLALFSEYKETGFKIKWVDDTHALIVFSSAKVAAEVVAQQRPLARCRPLHAATLESRNKVKKCAEFLQPYRQRPETCTALARRLVSRALGVKLSTARQERAEERRLIALAKEKKRQAALDKEAAWDGSLANQSPADSETRTLRKLF